MQQKKKDESEEEEEQSYPTDRKKSQSKNKKRSSKEETKRSKKEISSSEDDDDSYEDHQGPKRMMTPSKGKESLLCSQASPDLQESPLKQPVSDSPDRFYEDFKMEAKLESDEELQRSVLKPKKIDDIMAEDSDQELKIRSKHKRVVDDEDE